MALSLYFPAVTWPVDLDLTFDVQIGTRTETVTIDASGVYPFGVTNSAGDAVASTVPDLLGAALLAAFDDSDGPAVEGYEARWLVTHGAGSTAFLRWELELELDASAGGVLVTQTGDDLRPIGLRVNRSSDALVLAAGTTNAPVLRANGCCVGVFCPATQGTHMPGARWVRNVSRLAFSPGRAVVRAGGKVRTHALEWQHVPARFKTIDDAADPIYARAVGLLDAALYDDTNGTLEELLDAATAPGGASTVLRVYRDPAVDAVDGVLDFGGDVDLEQLASVSSTGATRYRVGLTLLEEV